MITEDEVKLLAFAYFALLLVYSHYSLFRMKKWPYVVGNLIELDVVNSYAASDYRRSVFSSVEYEYQVEGKKYIGNRLSTMFMTGNVEILLKKQFAKVQYVSENQIKVFYNPKKPHKSFLVLDPWYNIFGYMFGKKND